MKNPKQVFDLSNYPILDEYKKMNLDKETLHMLIVSNCKTMTYGKDCPAAILDDESYQYIYDKSEDWSKESNWGKVQDAFKEGVIWAINNKRWLQKIGVL